MYKDLFTRKATYIFLSELAALIGIRVQEKEKSAKNRSSSVPVRLP